MEGMFICLVKWLNFKPIPEFNVMRKMLRHPSEFKISACTGHPVLFVNHPEDPAHRILHTNTEYCFKYGVALNVDGISLKNREILTILPPTLHPSNA